MKFLQKPRNDSAKALNILYYSYEIGVSMATVLTQFEPCFYKFQSRLLEVEKAHPKLKIERTKKEYISKMDGKKRFYLMYRVVSPKPYLLNLYNLVNEKGLEGSVSDKSKIVPANSEENLLQANLEYEAK